MNSIDHVSKENCLVAEYEEEEADDRHSKSPQWNGWAQNGNDFGLELQEPWAEAVVDGRKSIETRLYNLPPSLLGKRIYIIQSPAGKDGISGMDNFVDFQQKSDDRAAKIIGWCIFSGVKLYKSQEEFEKDEINHLVSNNSGYGWKEGQTKAIYGWQVQQYEKIEPNTMFTAAIRRMRSLFQLKSE